MKIELFLALRYLLTRRKEKFLSLISLISIFGIAIGVMALIVVIGVMEGFDKDLREKIVGNYSHITISNYRGIPYEAYTTVSKRIAQLAHVTASSPNAQGQVLVKEGERFFAVALRGIDPVLEPKVTKINSYLVEGSLKDLTAGTVIIGKELAVFLGVGVNSDLTMFAASGEKNTLKVVGIFNSGMYDYDLNLIFTNIKTAQKILEMGNLISSIAVKLDNLYVADQVRKMMMPVLGFEYLVKTWSEANANFFAALKLEKLAMFIILTLIVLVASFNIISTLIVMVVQKTKDIGILKALGMNASNIRNIFTLEGIIIGVTGVALGGAGGMFLCWLLKKYQFIKLPQDIYYIDKLPVSIQLWPDVTLIIAAALMITLIATIYPAQKAAQLKPVEALRYE